jgi:SulP family sulfate permease
MPHRAHLFSLRIANALRESCITEPYTYQRFFRDLMAGVTVGIIAIPLAMALAIASGVPPQYGLYTAIIAGFLIPLTGGARYNISGPTAAFVVILFPVAQQFGLAGLLIASVLAGMILVAMALLRLGRLIEYIPEAVTLGFTGGIAIVIATLQMKDFFGLQLAEMPETYVDKVEALALALPTFSFAELCIAAVTFITLIMWPTLRTPVPPHLPAIIIASVLGGALNSFDIEVATIGSRFTYTLADGAVGHGIPPVLPEFQWPWLQTGPNGQPFELSFKTIEALLPAAFAIAMLGAIESLLCAVVLDNMTNTRHSANSELLGQGIGNIVTPFFGGITATAAIARSVVNLKSGAESPIASMIHAVVVLLALVTLASLLSYVPMAGLAALLVMVAWNMSEAPKSLHFVKTAPRGDVLVFAACLLLTVLFDMVIAITTGVLLAALLFIKEIADMTKVSEISHNKRLVPEPLPQGWQVYRISGPLFFAAADRVFGELAILIDKSRGVVISMEGVGVLDAGGIAAMQKFLNRCKKTQTQVIISDLQFQPLKTLRGANIEPQPGRFIFVPTLDEALELIPKSDTQETALA